MSAKPAPLKPGPRKTVYDGAAVPVKIKRLLDQPTVCAEAASAYKSVDVIGRAILLDLPDYCQKKKVDPAAVVTALSVFLATFEVFKEQYELDKQNAQPKEK